MSSEMWLSALAGFTGLHLAGRAYQAAGEKRDLRDYPPPGSMLNGMHIQVKGEGSPTVLFEAGLGASSVSWTCIEQKVSSYTRTVTYDRLGLGWSEAPTRPRLMPALVSEIAGGLDAAQVQEPMVIVGHSFGGYLARHFVAAHPHRVAALVLIDPLERGEFCPLSRNDEYQLRRGALLAQWGAALCDCGFIRLALEAVLKGSRILPRLMSRGVNNNGRGSEFTARLVGELGKLPPSTWPVIKAHWSVPKNLSVMADYFDALPSICTHPPDDSALRNLPLWVISTRTTPAARLAGHQRTARLSSRGQHVLADGAGHWVHLDEPALLLDIIHQAVESAARVSCLPAVELIKPPAPREPGWPERKLAGNHAQDSPLPSTTARTGATADLGERRKIAPATGALDGMNRVHPEITPT